MAKRTARKNKHIRFYEECAPCLRTLEKVLRDVVTLTIVSSDKVDKYCAIDKEVALANFGDCRVLVLDQVKKTYPNVHPSTFYESILFLADGDWWRSIYGE